MKKVLITMAVLASMLAGAMVLSSYVTPKQDVKSERTTTEVKVPTYWEGMAHADNDWDYVFIKVYQTEGMCNSFYAVIQSGYAAGVRRGDEVYVRNNPKYDSNSRNWRNKKYLITYRNSDYFFDM